MERTKHKSKKEKSNKYVEKEKHSSSTTDVKTIKENLKIRDILRTVKMNSSMRIKAPRGSKVMENKDFTDSCELFKDTTAVEGHDEEPLSATNIVINNNLDRNVAPEEFCALANQSANPIKTVYQEQECVNSDVTTTTNTDVIQTDFSENVEVNVDTSVLHKSKSLSEGLEACGLYDRKTDHNIPTNEVLTTAENTTIRTWDKKLSLPPSLLSKGLSHSEVDLNSIGKSPIERKSSFFRKKMDSFVKNTMEVFKKHSRGRKYSAEKSGSSSDGTKSVSLESLSKNDVLFEQYKNELMPKYPDQQGSQTSLRSATSQACSSTVSINVTIPPDQSEESLTSTVSRHELMGSQPLPDVTSISINNLSEVYVPDSMMNTRAISMNSGLDNANLRRRRNSSRSYYRVSWLASEGLADYFRRHIQDEKSRNGQCTSYQDISTIPEVSPYRTDSKGRRLSYQRAVSGEDPSKYQDTRLKRKKTSETQNPGGPPDITTCLADFSVNGVPALFGYTVRPIEEEAAAFLKIFGTDEEHEKHFEWFKDLPAGEKAKQAVIKELVYTEAHHIYHLKTIAEVYIAAAHALQDLNLLQDLNTSKLFLNIPDVLNANMTFWERTIYPMLKAANDHKTAFDTSLMKPGFEQFSEIFEPYDDYVHNQARAVEYLRRMLSNPDFVLYLNWCNQNTNNRLQLADILVKPMQRLTKYGLLINRLAGYIHQDDKKKELEAVERHIKAFTLRVNRGLRQREEIAMVAELHIETFDLDFKGDEEMEKCFKLFNKLDLGCPMQDCAPGVMRCLVHRGDLRFKDHLKEFDAHIFLFTDMILVCKKYTKGSYSYKMQRAKYLLNRAVPFTRASKSSHDSVGLIYVMLDDQGSSQQSFALNELSKDPNSVQTMRIWDQKLQEAMMTLVLIKWYTSHPIKDFSVIEAEYNAEEYKKSHPEAFLIERRARERVAAMMHPGRRVRDTSQELEPSVTDYDRARGPHNLHDVFLTGKQHFNALNLRTSSFHQSTTSHSSHNMSSSELHISMSGGSHEELQAVAKLYRSGSSLEQPMTSVDEVQPSITVNVVGENDTETLVPSTSGQIPAAVVQMPDSSSSRNSPTPRSLSAESSQNTLQVSPSHTTGVIYSLPDINTSTLHPYEELSDQPQTASEKLYRFHQDIMQRNRLAPTHQQYLSPDHRGSSYPPPSPSRASLKRGLAFSYSFKATPPLTRSKNVDSISQVQIEVPSISDRILGRKSPQPQGDPQPGTSRSADAHLTPSASTSGMSLSTSRADVNMPSTSAAGMPHSSQVDASQSSTSQDVRTNMPSTSQANAYLPSTSRGEIPTTAHKRQKKSFINRSREAHAPEPMRDDHSDPDTLDYDADDDRSRRSSKSNKSDKSSKEKVKGDKSPKEEKQTKVGKSGKSYKQHKEKIPEKPDKKDKKNKGKG